MPKKTITKKSGSSEAGSRRSANKYSRIRGVKDVLFNEYKYWDLIQKKIGDLAKVYGFKRIDTPILEKVELYERSTGKDTDIVSKEMYSFVDKGGERVALRPEATPGITRAYIEHGMFNLPQPVKTFWMGPVFRHEKPQAGRLRQHTQFNLDIFGETGPVADTQLILIAYNFFKELQIDAQIQINSIGCKDCRAAYISKLNKFYKERGKRSKLCPDCKKRFVKNPLRLLDCKEPECQAVREEAPQIVDFLCEDCRNHFIKVLEYLDELEVPYNLDPFLVRGLDYYNRTVFEVYALDSGQPAESAEAPEEEKEEKEEKETGPKRQAALGGGGRYDGLVELMGGRPTPACGFGIGIERVVLKIKEKNIPVSGDNGDIIFLAQLGDQSKRKCFVLFEELRRAGFKVRQAFTKDSLKTQLEEADRLGSRFTLILGQKELLDGTIIIRDMESGAQEIIDYKKVQSEISRRLEISSEKKEELNKLN